MACQPTRAFAKLRSDCVHGEGAGPRSDAVGGGCRVRWSREIFLPGFSPQDIAVRRVDRRFSVSAKAVSSVDPELTALIRRSLQLPDDVDEDSLVCWLEGDVLELRAGYRLPESLDESRRSGAAAEVDGRLVGSRWVLELPLPAEFQPADVVVTIDGGSCLTVLACWAESGRRREFERRLHAPSGVSLEQLECRVRRPGVLRLEAPLGDGPDGEEPRDEGRGEGESRCCCC